MGLAVDGLIQIGAAGWVTARSFDTEGGFDFLTIGTDRFSGIEGPLDLRVAAHTTVR